MKTAMVAVAFLLMGLFSTELSAQRPTLFIEEGQHISITLTGASGRVYEIFETHNLTSPVWTPLTNFVIAPTNTLYRFAVNNTGSKRFFRAFQLGALNMAWIPPGVFVSGSPENEQDRQSFEGPERSVTLTKGFYLCRNEVTQGEYLSVMGTNPSYFAGDLSRPVETVFWEEATNYCALRTRSEQDAGQLSAQWQYRLPTEAEWEHAARAGTVSRYSFGDDPGYQFIGDFAWYSANSLGTTHPVGTKLPNPWGLYDMHGNVAELCSDWFAAYPQGNEADPVGPISGPWKVFRGGNYYTPAPYARSASRQDANAPWNYLGGVGFRVVLVSSP